MAVRHIVLHAANPDFLRQKSESVQNGVNGVRQLIEDLKDTLLQHKEGIGLAAPQIAVHQRVIVVRLGADGERDPDPPVAIINPVIVESGDALPDFDGCLSFPGSFAKTVRPHALRLQGIDEEGEPFEWKLKGFDAVVVHHEVDHLDGILFIDRVTPPDKLHTEREMRTQ